MIKELYHWLISAHCLAAFALVVIINHMNCDITTKLNQFWIALVINSIAFIFYNLDKDS
jgi:hypothetical protein